MCKVNFFACILFHTSFPFIDIQHFHLYKKKFWSFDPTPFECKGKIFACMLFYALFHLIWYQHVHSQKKKCFYLLTLPQGPRVCIRAQYLLLCYCYYSSPLIWYAKWPYSEKIEFLAPAQPLQVHHGDQTQAFKLNSCLICFISFALLSACKILVIYI